MKDELITEERELLKSWGQGEWQSVADAELLDRYRQAARNTVRKDKRVNIRISSQDLELLQARALREGIPNQTLMASILHKSADGTLAGGSPTFWPGGGSEVPAGGAGRLAAGLFQVWPRLDPGTTPRDVQALAETFKPLNQPSNSIA